MAQRFGARGSIRPPQPVGGALRKLARLAVASSLGAAGGCGEDFDDWTPISCEDARNVLRNASFARERDYFGLLRDFNVAKVPSTERGISVIEYASSGVPCASASDRDACTSAFEAVRTVRDMCREAAQCGVFAVVNAGDQVRRIEDRAELLSWLAPIDNLSDALAISSWDDKPISCGDSIDRGTRYALESDRYAFATERDDCGVQKERDRWEVRQSGETTQTEVDVLGPTSCAIGRRTQGLCAIGQRFAVGSLAAHYAEVAHLEAASVYAFERLARELSGFGAPVALVAPAARSALDEVRHADMMNALARRFGGEGYAVRFSRLRARTLFEVAYENAVEGCVHETYGALVAHHQAACALDPSIRQVMRVIARDETQHAELAWQVAAWANAQLSAAQQETLLRARQGALRALELAQAQPVMPPGAARALGLPAPHIAQQLVRHLASMVLQLG